MICLFCNSVLEEKSQLENSQNNDAIFLFCECYVCAPAHTIDYRKLLNRENKLLADSIRIDEFYIIRNYVENKTSFSRNTNTVFEIESIWEIPPDDIKTLKNKLQLYTIFS